MKTLLIVDGSNLLFQMFYGMPNRIDNSSGYPIHGTIGFIGALLKMMRITDPSHAVVIFDGKCGNPRRDMLQEYKANRPDFSQMEDCETPFSQLPHIFSCLENMNIRYYETENCEADDVIASYAINAASDTRVIIASQDSDFFQLISNKVQILRYRGDNTVICNEEYVKEKFGILPEQYAEFKSLVGDKSDNIKGVDKVGVKTAAMLLNRFPSLEAIIENADKIEKISIRNSISSSADTLRLNHSLIKLNASQCVPFDIDELEITLQGETTMQILQKADILQH